MGLFNKNKKKESSYPEVNLPELPKLPELPDNHLSSTSFLPKSKPNALPRFPSNSLGNKFSRDSIKDAVSGEKEDDEIKQFEQEIQTRPKTPIKTLRREVLPEEENEELPVPKYNKPKSIEEFPSPNVSPKNGPIFIRLDKFEESLETFNKIKKQISNVDKLLKDIKRIKEQEERELESWESKLQTIKKQIEKIDKDIFSKIE